MQAAPEIMPKNDAFASVLHAEIGRPEAGTALGSHMRAQLGGKGKDYWLTQLSTLYIHIPPDFTYTCRQFYISKYCKFLLKTTN